MKKSKFLVILCLSIALIIGNISTVFASYGVISGQWQTANVNGRSYRYRASVSARGLAPAPTVEAMGESQTTDGYNAPAGYMGLSARLYNTSGQLVASSGMIYQDGACSNHFVYSSNTSKKGTYYAQTTAAFYNGSGYNNFTSNVSPNYNLKLLKPYNISESGKTYGSGLLSFTVGEEPELIAAIGINGKEGYVYSSDLNPKLDTPEQAIIYTKSVISGKEIPLYNLEGEIIDSFLLSTIEKERVSELEKALNN